jgi:hypothetical protein
MIKAIETRYKGYRFRSRLEARWAVFFDKIGLEWLYEPEGFDLGEIGWYLPDFYLPDWKSYIEIKPTIPSFRELLKSVELIMNMNASRDRNNLRYGYIICGTPGRPKIVRDDSGWLAVKDGYAVLSITGKYGEDFISPFISLSCFCYRAVPGAVEINHIYLGKDSEQIIVPTDVVPTARWMKSVEKMIADTKSSEDQDQRFKLIAAQIQLAKDQNTYIVPTRFIGCDCSRDLYIPLEGASMKDDSPFLEFSVADGFYIGDGIRYYHQTLMKAYEAARSARFEYGENGE